jgi:hypothetical protein
VVRPQSEIHVNGHNPLITAVSHRQKEIVRQ